MQAELLKLDIKAMQVFDWLKDEFQLGRGHGMAIYHVLKEGPSDSFSKQNYYPQKFCH